MPEMNTPSLTQLNLWRRSLPTFVQRLRPLLPFGLGIFATLIGLLLYSRIFPPPAPLTMTEVDANVAEALAAVTPSPAYSALVYQVVQPSLVLVQTRISGEDDEEDNGIGSGVVISTAGDILTSLHVVDGATEIRLTFADGTQSSGEIVAVQPENDIAVLRAERPPALLIPAVLGNPDAMRVGDEAFVVGHPLGLYGSMSTGVISGFDRTFRPTNSEQRIEGLIQIDAAVNPGNSGGPLLNRNGQVVGIVAGLVNPTENNFFVGIGFAVPIDIAGAAAGLPPY
jgi:S1-C subfamily serine protease